MMLKGKVAVITGGTRGIGYATVQKFLGNGAKVVLFGSRQETVDKALGSRLRQCPDHYTIRAGRNLPDKEFRYLRTVIVTAAVYRGFNSNLLTKAISSPLNLPAPGRCQTVYIFFRISTALCFC